MKIVPLLLLCLLGQPAFAETAKLAKVILYQPEEVMVERLSDVKRLAAYIKALRPLCEQQLTGADQESVDVVIVVKPNGQARAWFVSSLSAAPDRSGLKAQIEEVQPPAVQSGPVVFGLAYNLNGYVRSSSTTESFQPPIPTEWKEKAKAAKEPLQIPDGFVPYVWPD